MQSNLDHKKALVVLSGGQDSTTCLHWATHTYGKDAVEAIAFDYGQRHAIELQSARRVASLAGVSLEVLTVGKILDGRSPLTNPAEQLETYDNFQQMDKVIGDRVELTFVPMRNLMFLVIAANRAVCMGFGNLVTGVCQADNANYPDCRAVFIEHARQALNYAIGADKWPQTVNPIYKFPQDSGLHIETPLMDMSKAQSIKLALSIKGAYEALAYTHTAYDGRYPPVGKDHASVLRAHGFEEAGVPDPLVVRAWHEGLIDLPVTENYRHLKEQYMALSQADVSRAPSLDALLQISRGAN